MNNKFKILLISSLLILVSNVNAFDYAAYKEIALSTMLQERSKDECRETAENEFIYSAYAHKYRFKTKFTRELREIGEDKKLYLERYGKSMRWNQDVVKLYKREFLVIENGKEYWVPVQEQLLPYMGREIEVGKLFELYVAVIGSASNECIFIATEFKSNAGNT